MRRHPSSDIPYPKLTRKQKQSRVKMILNKIEAMVEHDLKCDGPATPEWVTAVMRKKADRIATMPLAPRRRKTEVQCEVVG